MFHPCKCSCHQLIGQCQRCGGNLTNDHVCPDEQIKRSIELAKQIHEDLELQKKITDTLKNINLDEFKPWPPTKLGEVFYSRSRKDEGK